MAHGRVDILDSSSSLLQKMVKLSWPVALSMLFHTSYNAVDMFWVASLGKQAVAAVTLAGIILWAGFALSQIFASGALAVLARVWGAGNGGRAGIILRDALGLSLITGTTFAVVVGMNARECMILLGGAPDVIDLGAEYVVIAVVGFAVSIVFFTVTTAFRAVGDTVTPLVLTGISCIINAALDPVLIFGLVGFPKMGVAGAAAATAVATSSMFIVAIYLLLNPRSDMPLQIRGRPDWLAIKDMISVGIPSGVHYILLSLIQAVMLRLVALFGTAAVAAAGISSRITMFSFLPCMALGSATATMVGQFLGAKRINDAEETVKTAIKGAVAITAGIGLIYAMMPDMLLRIFTQDTEVIRMGRMYLWIFAASFVFVSVTIVMTRAFQGAGDTVWPGVVAAVRFVFFLGLCFYYIRFTNLEAYGVWLAMAFSHMFQLCLLCVVFAKGTWTRRKLRSAE